MASATSTAKTSVPDGIFFELSPRIVFTVRVVNVCLLIVVLITFILCLVQGGKETNNAFYLLACNTAISACVGIVVNWWYKSGDLGSEKFWYVLVVAGVLAFQCITTDIFIFNVKGEVPVPATTMVPPSNHTQEFSWATFRSTPVQLNFANHTTAATIH